MSERYPTVELDPVERLRVIAAATPGAAVAERVLDAPFDAVWSAATDFEGNARKIELMIGSAEVVSREGDRLIVDIRPPLGPRQRSDVVLRPGWCLMQSRLALAAMAARPEGERTRFAHLEAFRVPGARVVVRPFLSAKMWLARELPRIERLARERLEPQE